MAIERIRIVDTHTAGEPTRVVLDSPIRFSSTVMRERREQFRTEFDDYRRAIVCEPRGSDVMVGALLTPPERSTSQAGVIFFNNIGYLGMCGHGMIGVAVALRHLGRISSGKHVVDTPVGSVTFEINDHNQVTLQNVASYRFRRQVPIALDDGSLVHGDIAWGGNWFFICDDHGLAVQLAQLEQLTAFARGLRRQLDEQGITGANGEVIDHVELLGPPTSSELADSKNFVLCPGAAYDRSPCGTGTSAKLACLAADDKLAAGQIYRQESIVGSVFQASYQPLSDGQILPTIVSKAFVNGEGSLIIDPADPFGMGISS